MSARTGGIVGAVGVAVLLTGCASPRPAYRPDPAIAVAARAARLVFDEGKPERAAPLYRRALTRARAADDAHEIANSAYNLAACLTAMGEYAEAWRLLLEAEREAGRVGASRGDMLLLRARVARATSRAAEAEDLLRAYLLLATRPEERILAELAYGHLACDAGDRDAAEARIRNLLTSRAARGAEPAVQAEIQGLAGRLAALRKQPLPAAGFYDRQAEHLRADGRYREMAYALGRAAEQYRAADDWAAAWDRAHRAARGFLAQGDAPAALRQAEQALEAAGHLENEECHAATAAITEEIRALVEPDAETE